MLHLPFEANIVHIILPITLHSKIEFNFKNCKIKPFENINNVKPMTQKTITEIFATHGFPSVSVGQ